MRSPPLTSGISRDQDKRAEMVAKRHAFSFGFEDWNLEGTVRLVGPAVRGQVQCVNHPASCV